MAPKQREPVPNLALYNLRDAAGLTQQELADAITELGREQGKKVSVDNMTISRWERGVIERPSPVYRCLLAQIFKVSLDELGFTRPKSFDDRTPDLDLDVDAFLTGHSPLDHEPRVKEDQEQWRNVRAQLNSHRAALASAAVELYDADHRVRDTNLIAAPGWILDRPVPLDTVTLTHHAETMPTAVTGIESQSRSVRPLATSARRYPRYSYAVREVGHPGLFENRLSYRLANLENRRNRVRMTFGHTTYFDAIDVCEASAHEMARTHLRESDHGVVVGRPSWRSLPLRRLVGDPFDLTRRVVLPSINTLTIRKAPDRVSFVLHNRSADRVAVAGGMLHVMPAGVFQPSSLLPSAQVEDFDLWRNMMREYSEEFLGNPEHGGDGVPIDYDSQPFVTMTEAFDQGRIRSWYLGTGVDALTLFGEILTVTVFDADVYDELFAEMVEANEEGTIVVAGSRTARSTAIPFDEMTVPRLLEERERFAPAAAACLRLAWEHRDVLLAS